MSLTILATTESRRRLVYSAAALCLIVMVGLGVMARNGWLPNTDPVSGKKTGWFGKVLPKNAASSWNPLAAPLPTPTPQLSKEYVYAGSRLLSVVDANANEVPPADLAVWRPSSGAWYVMGPGGTIQASASWGIGGDIPVQGDYDGDGKTDFSVFRPSTNTWYLIYSSNSSTTQFGFGASGDIPAAADYDGDGKTDVAVFRPSTGFWYILKSSDNGVIMTPFGLSTDIPTPADYDGDGKADISVWRNSDHTFYTVRSSDSTLQTATFGASGDKPVPADYDGDGKANYALRSGATWLILQSDLSTVTSTTPSGDAASDIPVPNDYDGDGKCDIAVWRDSNGHWYIRESGSSNVLREEAWGMTGDTPVPAFYRR